MAGVELLEEDVRVTATNLNKTNDQIVLQTAASREVGSKSKGKAQVMEGSDQLSLGLLHLSAAVAGDTSNPVTNVDYFTDILNLGPED